MQLLLMRGNVDSNLAAIRFHRTTDVHCIQTFTFLDAGVGAIGRRSFSTCNQPLYVHLFVALSRVGCHCVSKSTSQALLQQHSRLLRPHVSAVGCLTAVLQVRCCTDSPCTSDPEQIEQQRRAYNSVSF